MTDSVLELDRVSRAYGPRRALSDVSLALARGEVLGLLGVNGAGKSTALRLAAGVLRPQAGVVRIAGRDLANAPELARGSIGYLPDPPPLYRELRVDEYLAFCARLRGLRGARAAQAIAGAVERCGLGEVRRRLCGALSRGFAQRAGLAQAILHAPAVLLLDEPTAGLDPVQVHRFHELIAALRADCAILLSTHHLDEARRCCSRVAILHEGRLHAVPADAPADALERRFLDLALGRERADAA